MYLISGAYAETPFDRQDLPQSLLNIEDKSQRNSLSWRGQFSPQLVQTLLQYYAPEKGQILDPFLGSGTVLYEAGKRGLTAVGVEINPAAVILSRLYELINIATELRQKTVDYLTDRLSTFGITNNLPLSKLEKPELLLSLITNTIDPVAKKLLESLIIRLDLSQAKTTTQQVRNCWGKIVKLIQALPFSEQPLQVVHGDARKLPLQGRSINFVLTSPPYINVFNYHQQYRGSAEALQWDLLKVAKSEIGCNRKHRSNRFLTVIQYCLDLTQSLLELYRVARADARLLFVVGRESNVLGTRFHNGEIVCEIATRCLDFRLILKQERFFVNRFGQIIFEDILHFSLPKHLPKNSFLEGARAVAIEILTLAIQGAPEKAKNHLKLAIENGDRVLLSPEFKVKTVCQ